MLTEEQIKDYQKVYRKVYGKDIPYKDAEESAHKLINLCKILIKHQAESDNKKYYVNK